MVVHSTGSTELETRKLGADTLNRASLAALKGRARAPNLVCLVWILVPM